MSVADGALPSRPVRIEGFAEARVLVLQVEDPRDPGDVDAVPAEFGRATQAGDVVVAVPTRAAVTASGREKPLLSKSRIVASGRSTSWAATAMP